MRLYALIRIHRKAHQLVQMLERAIDRVRAAVNLAEGRSDSVKIGRGLFEGQERPVRRIRDRDAKVAMLDAQFISIKIARRLANAVALPAIFVCDEHSGSIETTVVQEGTLEKCAAIRIQMINGLSKPEFVLSDESIGRFDRLERNIA